MMTALSRTSDPLIDVTGCDSLPTTSFTVYWCEYESFLSITKATASTHEDIMIYLNTYRSALCITSKLHKIFLQFYGTRTLLMRLPGIFSDSLLICFFAPKNLFLVALAEIENEKLVKLDKAINHASCEGESMKLKKS